MLAATLRFEGLLELKVKLRLEKGLNKVRNEDWA